MTEDKENVINLKEELIKYLTHWRWFVLSVFMSLILAFIYLKFTPKSYSVATKVLIKDEKSEEILYNITEKLVLNKLDATLKRMNCCRCDRCKQDIVAIALNSLKPMYIVSTRDEIEQKILKLKDVDIEVTTEVIKAVLTVRKNPRH